jgi:hypothetical protein
MCQKRVIDDDDYGALGEMIVRGNWSTRRKPAPVPLCPPQIPHDLTWHRTRAAALGCQRLTAWAMARPFVLPHFLSYFYFIDIFFLPPPPPYISLFFEMIGKAKSTNRLCSEGHDFSQFKQFFNGKTSNCILLRHSSL